MIFFCYIELLHFQLKINLREVKVAEDVELKMIAK